MAQAGRYTGKDMAITIGGTAINSEYQSLKVKESVESAEATAGSDTHEYSIPLYGTSEIEVEVFGVNKADAGYTNIKAQTAKGALGPLIWGPEGTTSGKPKFTATGYVEEREEEYTFKDAVTLKFKFKCTAAIVEATYTV